MTTNYRALKVAELVDQYAATTNQCKELAEQRAALRDEIMRRRGLLGTDADANASPVPLRSKNRAIAFARRERKHTDMAMLSRKVGTAVVEACTSMRGYFTLIVTPR